MVSEHCTPQVRTLNCTFTCTPVITKINSNTEITSHYYVYDSFSDTYQIINNITAGLRRLYMYNAITIIATVTTTGLKCLFADNLLQEVDVFVKIT